MARHCRRAAVCLLAAAFSCVAGAEEIEAGLAWEEEEALSLLQLRLRLEARELGGNFPSTPVDCGLDEVRDSSTLLLLTSDAIGGSPALKNALRELVLRLPDTAWDNSGGEGAAKKHAARAEDRSALLQKGFNEPQLYDGLYVLDIEDAGILKDSMWDASYKAFNKSVTYKMIGSNSASEELVKNVTGFKGLDNGWSLPWIRGGFSEIGFTEDQIHSVSIFDRLASNDLKRAVFKLESDGTAPADAMLSETADTSSARHAELWGMLQKANILLVNGGNPDMLEYVLLRFAPEFGAEIQRRVKEGSLVYVGRSAGTMAGSADDALTFEPKAQLQKIFNRGSTRGLALSGNCAVRPHYTDQTWDLNVMFYANATGYNVLRLPNKEALQCIGVTCRVVGNTGKLGPTLTKDAHGDFHPDRIIEVIKEAATRQGREELKA